MSQKPSAFMARAWIFLLGAIATEVTGTTVMKLVSHQPSAYNLIFMYVMVGFSFYLLAKTLQYMPIVIAYAIWEGVGLAIISLVGLSLFQEQFGPAKIIGLVSLVTGVIVINFGEAKESNEECAA